MDLQKILASSCRQKILRELSKSEEIKITCLVFRINSTYNDVNRNIGILKRENIVFDEHRGRIRLVGLRRENLKTKKLLQVLRELNANNGAFVADNKLISLLPLFKEDGKVLRR